MVPCWFRLNVSFHVTSQHKLRTIAHVGTLYQPLRGRFAEPIQQRKLLVQQCGGGDNINWSQNLSSPIRGRTIELPMKLSRNLSSLNRDIKLR